MKGRAKTEIELEEVSLTYITILLSAEDKFLGLYGIPERGGYYWVDAVADDGYVNTEEEAIAKLVE